MPRERNDYRRVTLNLSRMLKLYVIAAEGDKTEYRYFTELTAMYGERFRMSNLHVELLERPEQEARKSDPKYVGQMIDIFLANNREYDFQPYDEVWLIVDTDEYEHRREILLELAGKCQENALLHLGLSNPCFEVWLLLHFVALTEQIEAHVPDATPQTIREYIEATPIRQRAKACKRLLPFIHQNQQPLYKNYITRIPEAIQRAKQLGGCDPCASHFPDRICTSVYQLFEHLLHDLHQKKEFL